MSKYADAGTLVSAGKLGTLRRRKVFHRMFTSQLEGALSLNDKEKLSYLLMSKYADAGTLVSAGKLGTLRRRKVFHRMFTSQTIKRNYLTC